MERSWAWCKLGLALALALIVLGVALDIQTAIIIGRHSETFDLHRVG